jgi:hypothetical protein
MRCQVLRTIASIGPCGAEDIREHLPHFSIKQIQKTCSRLNRQDDEIKVVATTPSKNDGNPCKVYQVRGEDEERKIATKEQKSNAIQTRSTRLKTPMRYDKERERLIIFNRERKIELLESLKIHTADVRKDLLMGIIHDLKQE